jgi:Integrase zinc binding domain
MKRYFAVNDKGLLVRLSPLDEAEQVVVPRCLAIRVMCLAHLPRLAAHPGGTRMYATLRKSFYWLTMAKDIYQFLAHLPRLRLILVVLACMLPSISHSIDLLRPKIYISLSRIVRRAPRVI